MPFPLAGHLMTHQAMEFGIDDGSELFERGPVAVVPSFEKTAEVLASSGADSRSWLCTHHGPRAPARTGHAATSPATSLFFKSLSHHSGPLESYSSGAALRTLININASRSARFAPGQCSLTCSHIRLASQTPLANFPIVRRRWGVYFRM
jgi:hypothetical protein